MECGLTLSRWDGRDSESPRGRYGAAAGIPRAECVALNRAEYLEFDNHESQGTCIPSTYANHVNMPRDSISIGILVCQVHVKCLN